MRRALLLGSAALLLASGCAKKAEIKGPVSTDAGPILRVAVASASSEVTVACDWGWNVALNGKREEPTAVDPGGAWAFRHEGGRSIRAYDETGVDRGLFTGTILLYPETAGATMRHRGRNYRGYFVLTADGDGLTLVNRLRMEHYVRGVVGNEIGHGTDETLPALKAQAVAARTYAYLKAAKRADELFDLSSSATDQVYTGASGESSTVAKACADTNGELLTFGGSPVEALYSATCGGRTADPREIWFGDAQPHLQSRRDRVGGNDLCSHARYYRWETRWTAEGFLATFKRFYPRYYAWDGTPFGALRDVRVTERGASGRVTEMTVDTAGGRFLLTGDTIRWILRRSDAGQPALWSTSFDVDVERSGNDVTSVVMRGRGYGHGVGMCQAGALAMSEAGYDYREILRHYYPGTRLDRAY